MSTHAELAGKLLEDAATFFQTLASQNESLFDQMTENAAIFTQMGGLIVNEPLGNMDGTSNAELVGRLLKDAATFFRTLAEENEPIKEQMLDNADIYEKIADLVKADPLGILD